MYAGKFDWNKTLDKPEDVRPYCKEIIMNRCALLWFSAFWNAWLEVWAPNSVTCVPASRTSPKVQKDFRGTASQS